MGDFVERLFDRVHVAGVYREISGAVDVRGKRARFQGKMGVRLEGIWILSLLKICIA